MATWGINNFESDSALNCLGELVQGLIAEIRHTFTLDTEQSLYGDYGEGRIIANIDILSTLCVHYEHLPSLEISEISNWKTMYLQTFDRNIQYYRMDDEYIIKRRVVIEATFDNLTNIINKLGSD